MLSINIRLKSYLGRRDINWDFSITVWKGLVYIFWLINTNHNWIRTCFWSRGFLSFELWIVAFTKLILIVLSSLKGQYYFLIPRYLFVMSLFNTLSWHIIFLFFIDIGILFSHRFITRSIKLDYYLSTRRLLRRGYLHIVQYWNINS